MIFILKAGKKWEFAAISPENIKILGLSHVFSQILNILAFKERLIRI